MLQSLTIGRGCNGVFRGDILVKASEKLCTPIVSVIFRYYVTIF